MDKSNGKQLRSLGFFTVMDGTVYSIYIVIVLFIVLLN